jgi:hypothetical protein
MPGSKKTSVDPAARAMRYADLCAALETGELSVVDILEVARQATDAHIARADREQAAPSPAPQPASAFASQPSVYVSRSGHSLTFAYGKDVTFDDVIAAVKRLEATQPDSPQRQPARESAAKPPSAFDLRRSFARTSAEPLIDEPWRDQTTEGPADLIRHFAAVAVSEHWSEITLHDEKTWSLIMDVAEFATDVAVRLAGVSETWADEYRALIGGSRK